MRNIILCAMTKKGYSVVEHIVARTPEMIRFVVIGRDSHTQEDHSNEIAQLCERKGIMHYSRGSEPEFPKEDYVFAVSWRWMITHPNNRLIIFHDSLLPKYRGFAPLVNALINGEERIGVTALFGNFEYDKGEIIASESSKLAYPIKIAQAIDENNRNYLTLVGHIVEKLARGEILQSTSQDERNATYSIWRDEDDYLIDWNNDATKIKRMIDALGFPYLGARTRTVKNETVILHDAEVVPDVVCGVRHIGKVIFVEDGAPVVMCGTGLLRITKASIVTNDVATSLIPVNSFRIRFI